MARERLTLAQIAEMDCVMLTPKQVAAYTGGAPYAISLMAATPEGRDGLGYPVVRVGTRTKIPRIPFLKFMGWQGKIAGAGVEA